MRKIIIISLVLGLLVSCKSVNEKTYSIYTALADLNYQVSLGMTEDEDYESALAALKLQFELENISLYDYYTIKDETNEIGYLYELEDLTSSELLFNQFSVESYNALNIWFIYKIDLYVFKMSHAVDSDFPVIFSNQVFEYNYQYDYHYLNGSHPFLEELRYQGVYIAYYSEYGMTYQETIQYMETGYNISFKDIHAYRYYQNSQLRGGYIYEVFNAIDAEILFQYERNSALASSHSYYVYKYQNLVIASIGPSELSGIFWESKNFEHNLNDP